MKGFDTLPEHSASCTFNTAAVKLGERNPQFESPALKMLNALAVGKSSPFKATVVSLLICESFESKEQLVPEVFY